MHGRGPCRFFLFVFFLVFQELVHFTGRQGSDVNVTKGSRRVRGQVGS